MALFLASINNSLPNTTNGQSSNEICHLQFSLVKNIISSNSKTLNIYNNSLLSSSIQQRSELINAYQSLLTNTIISPRIILLNDIRRRIISYQVTVMNIGTISTKYKFNHVGAAIAIVIQSNDDQLLDSTLYTEDYAVTFFLFC